MSKRRRFALLALTLGGTLVGLGISELALRLHVIPREVQVSGWKLCRKHWECNELGYRGQSLAPIEGALKVVLLGDSQVSAWAQRTKDTPERRLEFHLQEQLGRPVQVFTVGCDGYGQDQEYLALQEYFVAHDADLVLLWYNTGNDLENTLFPTSASGTPKPTFWLEAGRLEGPSESWLSPIIPAVGLRGLVTRYSAEERNRDWERHLPPPHQPVTSFEGVVGSDWQRLWDSGRSHGFRDMAREMTTTAIRLTPRSPRTLRALDLTRALLGAMDRLSAEHGADFQVFFEQRPPLSPELGVTAQSLNGAIYLVSEAQERANLDHLFGDRVHHRLALSFPDVTVSETDGHLNVRAIESVMRQLASRLAERGIGGSLAESPTVVGATGLPLSPPD